MADRYPLIANSNTKRIEELASGDNLNLSGNSVSGITTITANQFVGDLKGTADSSKLLTDGANILSGTISSQRLSGYYPIQVAYASSVDADGIINGVIPSNVLSGSYDIDITGTAQTANFLTSAGNILDGVLDSERLTGNYNINITGVANSALSLSPGIYDVDITGSAAFATTAGYSTSSGTASNVVGGIGSITDLDVSGITTLATLGVTGLTTTKDLSVSGIVSAFGIDLISDSNISTIKSDVGLSIISPNIGINTNYPNYNLDIRGDISIDSRLYANSPAVTIASTTGTLASDNLIVGVNTESIQLGDIVVDVPQSRIFAGTIVQAIGINSVTVSPNHIVSGSETRNLLFNRPAGQSPGLVNQVLVSGGTNSPVYWGDPTTLVSVGVAQTNTNESYGVLFTKQTSGPVELRVDNPDINYNPETNKLSVNGTVESNTFIGNLSGIASTALSLSDAAGIVTGIVSTSRLSGEYNIDISGNAATATTSTNVSGGIATVTELNVSGVSTLGVVTATSINVTNNVIAAAFIGDGVALSGIVTQITAGVGVNVTPVNGKGSVKIDAYRPTGKTIFVNQNGNDNNSGLSENNAKRTIKAAASVAVFGDTIKVYPGVYVEENPVVLKRTVSVEGTELRNCVVTPRYPYLDLFHVNNGCHITDISFIGPDMTDGAAVVALQPLEGVSVDRYFDAARMIRLNLDYIAKESVGFITSTQYIGAGRTQESDPVLQVVDAQGNPVDSSNCSDDIKDIWKCVIHDITRGGNSKCVNAGLSYYTEGALVHIAGTDPNGYSIKAATIDAIDHSFNIARAMVNNCTWGSSPVGLGTTVTNAIYDYNTGLTTVTAINHGLSKDDAVKIVGLEYECDNGSPAKPVGVLTAAYSAVSGITTVTTNTSHNLSSGMRVRLENLVFECNSGGGLSTALYPSGNYGYDFTVQDVLSPFQYTVNVGVSTLEHTYVEGGTSTRLYTPVFGVSTAVYDNVTGITTIITTGIGTTTGPQMYIEPGRNVKLENLVFECNSGGGGPSTALYPSGNLGYSFEVISTNDDRYVDASNLIEANRVEIIDKSLAAIAIAHSDFYFPVGVQTTRYSRFKDSYRLIQQNKQEIIDASWDQTLVAYPSVLATETKCKRDLGYFVDAISTDIFTGGNSYAIEFVKQYFDANGDPIANGLVGEEIPSIFAFNSARNNMKLAITNNLTIKDLTLTPDPITGSNTNVNSCADVQSTLNTLTEIVTTVIGNGDLDFINSIAKNSGIFVLGENKCRRDIGYVVDALIKDIRYGTSKYIREATRAYFDATGTPIANGLVGEEAPSVTAFNAVRDYAKQAMRNLLNVKDLTITADPLTGDNQDPNSCADVATNIDNLISILTTAVTDGNLDSFPALYVSNKIKVNVGVSTLVHTYVEGGTVTSNYTTNIFPDGTYNYIFPVQNVIDSNTFEFVGGKTNLPHTYVSGGTIQKYENFQNTFTQVKDLGIQVDPETGYNNTLNSCANVISAMRSCVGVVTTIVGLGTESNIKTTYPGNSGYGVDSYYDVYSATYDETTGKAVILAPGIDLEVGDLVEIRDLLFECESGIVTSTQLFPSGAYGYEFFVEKVNSNNTFEISVGVSTLPHTYVSGGVAINRKLTVSEAYYDNTTGITTITVPGLSVETGNLIRLKGLEFSCESGAGTTTIYPTGNEGYDFRVLDIIVDKPLGVTTATYDNISGLTTITASGFNPVIGNVVEIRNLEFSCPDSPPNLLYPSGKNGYEFQIQDVNFDNSFVVNVGPSTIPHTYVSGGTVTDRRLTANDTFTIQVGTSTIPHTYVSGGLVSIPYSKGVGNIVQGPYIRNCTNFIPKSIGMRIDGFAAEPGDQDDIGVTGTMSVDSYTQYNQGGIGVSISNGAYAQLVSIFTICNDIAIYTESGGQCDITNSNSSFGRLGLVANGVGDAGSKSIYRSTAVAITTAAEKTNTVTISGVGSYRPYDGQVCYFGELLYFVDTIDIIDGGDGYTSAPRVTVSAPEGANGITAQASTTIENGRVVSVNIVNSGTQYKKPPTITIAPPQSGTQATARVGRMQPIYYKVDSATLPSAGVSTVSLLQNLNNEVGAGTTVYFSRVSLQITSSHSFEWVGSGNDINKAKPALGGVVIPENEVIQENGGLVVYTSTDQAGNFKIGDGVVINQATGQISGRDFTKALFTTMTPFILALSE